MDNIIDTPIGKLAITIIDNTCISVELNTRKKNLSASLHPFAIQIQRYFEQADILTDIPFELKGTNFQKKVWLALSKIPLGDTLTYGELAKKLNSHPRAIGQACKKNPIPIVIPCHRVVSQAGIGGFSGETKGKLIDTKTWLLKHEEAL